MWPGDQHLRVSPEVFRILGIETETEVLSISALLDHAHRADRERMCAWFSELVLGQPQPATIHRIVSPDKQLRWVRQQVEISAGDDRSPRVLYGTLQDITELHLAEDRIRQLAFFDSLTGLPNRTLFHDRFSQALSLAKRHRRELALLFMDLDDFKRINDTLGHAVGDLLLQATATRLIASVRASDGVFRPGSSSAIAHMARIGGDEFTVMLPDLHQSSDAEAVARRIASELSKPVSLAGHQFVVTPSIGIAIFPKDGDTPDTLLKHADAAMYFAKREGKNRYHFFDATLNEEASARLIIEGELRAALEQDDFFVHYQPQLSLSTRRICGVEALARWNSPLLGNVPPRAFIPIADETGLIVPIGERILRAACAQTTEWQQAGLHLPRVAVNISPTQFAHADFIPLVSRVLEETGLAPGTLELELTEGLLMTDPENAVRSLERLKAIGVQLAIDNFGTGYSSLSRLKQLPIDRLKIDHSFIRDLTTRVDDEAIVITVIAMADAMGLAVIAAGVENEEQAQLLMVKGCTEIQGAYVGGPLPPSQIVELLRDSTACDG